MFSKKYKTISSECSFLWYTRVRDVHQEEYELGLIFNDD